MVWLVEEGKPETGHITVVASCPCLMGPSKIWELEAVKTVFPLPTDWVPG